MENTRCATYTCVDFLFSFDMETKRIYKRNHLELLLTSMTVCSLLPAVPAANDYSLGTRCPCHYSSKTICSTSGLPHRPMLGMLFSYFT